MSEYKRIWLIYTGESESVWCDSPDPSPDIDPEDVTGPFVLNADRRIAELEAEVERWKDRYLVMSQQEQTSTAENELLRAEIDPCRQYQKDGESLAECLERNRRDAGRALRLYGEMKAENELYRWLKENSDYASTVVGNIEITDAAIGAAREE